MDITWYGHSCFRLKDRINTVVTDPYDKSLGLILPKLKADIVTVSHDVPHHNCVNAIKDEFKLIDGPGEYEIGSTFVTGVRLEPPKNQTNGNGNNIVFVLYMDDMAICHLGDLGHVPTQSQVEGLGSIDLLFVPVGGHNALNASQAAEVISLIEPSIVVPMHYQLPGLSIKLDPVGKFLKEMGIAKADPEDSFRILKSNLPEETQVVLLAPKI